MVPYRSRLYINIIVNVQNVFISGNMLNKTYRNFNFSVFIFCLEESDPLQRLQKQLYPNSKLNQYICCKISICTCTKVDLENSWYSNSEVSIAENTNQPPSEFSHYIKMNKVFAMAYKYSFCRITLIFMITSSIVY